MAGVLDEFDEATPLTKRYCSRVSKQDYDQQTSESTEDALEQLLEYLDANPQIYANILKKKSDEENESQGLLGYFKQHFWSFWSRNGSARSEPTEEECQKKLGKLKENMIKAYEYSQEAKGMTQTPTGRRFSQRLLQKKLKKSNLVVPPAPPPPPPPPPPVTSIVPAEDKKVSTVPLKRRALHDSNQQFSPTTGRMREKPYYKKGLQTADLVKELQGSAGRKRLKKTITMRSPGGTPLGGWPKNKPPDTGEMAPMFNLMLLQKFANARSPSPTMGYSASPGAFDSPSVDKEN